MFELFSISMVQLMAYCGFIQSRRFKDPLTKEKEAEMLILLAKGDAEAREMLIEHNLRLVAHIVKKYDIKKMERDDLISIGTIGLIKAVDTFKIESGHKLTTYAARCIENEILMALRSNIKHFNTLSLNESIQESDGNALSLIDVIADEQIDIISDFMKLENVTRMMTYFPILDEREKDILTKRYGLFGHHEMTQKEIAIQYNISRSYVSRIEKRATIKLFKEFSKKKDSETLSSKDDR